MNELQRQLRDQFFALSPTSAEAEAFRARVDEVTEVPQTRVGGLRVSPFPTRWHKVVRFFDPAQLAEQDRAHFAHPLPNLPHLAAGFVDPGDLSFRSFENIISLDGYFEGLALESLKLDQRSRFGDKQVYAFQLAGDEAVRQRLAQLDGLGLYAPPLNKGSRGG